MRRFACFRLSFFCLCLLLCAAPALGAGIIADHPKVITEGEQFLLKLSGEALPEEVRVLWRDKSLPLKKGRGGMARLLLPAPLGVTENSLPLRLLDLNGRQLYAARIKLRRGSFGEQRLTVDPHFVTPPEAELPCIEQERARMRALYAVFTQEDRLRLPLRRPLPGVITGDFGVRRLFNRQPRNRPLGVDFRGAEGEEARAVASGRVVLTDSQYYAGYIVVVDHGLGVYSMYMHLSAIKVKEGEDITVGTVLGLVGKTGRTTGPHLHLGFVVQGEYQTPAPFMPDM